MDRRYINIYLFIIIISHDATEAVLVSQNNEMAAMLVSQIKLFSYVNTLFFPRN